MLEAVLGGLTRLSRVVVVLRPCSTTPSLNTLHSTAVPLITVEPSTSRTANTLSSTPCQVSDTARRQSKELKHVHSHWVVKSIPLSD